jgi:hypothetical protein
MYRLIAIGTVLMAIVAAVAYVLMGMGVLQAGNLTDEAMPSFFYIIPAAYVMMGLGVFLRWRWIKVVDAVLVFFTIAVFYARYADQPDVMWSAPGLITKIAQVLMLAGLIYMLVKSKPIKAPEAK